VSYADRTITVGAQLDRHRKRVPLKTKRSRRVLEITSGLVGALREHSLGTGRKDPHALVFATSRGTGHDHRNIGGRVLGKAVEGAGLGAVEVGGEVVQRAPTFHDLRHSHASALIAQGWDPVEVSARLGHASVATTLSIYAHEWDAARRSDERRARLDRLYGNAMETTGRSRRQQTDGQTRADTPELRVISDAA
jgi:integrase